VSTDPTAAPESSDRKGAWLALAGLVALLAVLYAAGVVFVGNRIPAGTEVSGVDIGSGTSPVTTPGPGSTPASRSGPPAPSG